MAKPAETLSNEVIEFLQGERIVSVVTMDKERKRPTVSTVSWLVAQEDGKTIKFAVGHKASVSDNLLEDPYIVLTVLGPESSYEVIGTAKVSETFDGTMKFKVVTVDIETVYENMFYGGKITTVPQYEKTYDAELAKKIDNEIYEKLKG